MATKHEKMVAKQIISERVVEGSLRDEPSVTKAELILNPKTVVNDNRDMIMMWLLGILPNRSRGPYNQRQQRCRCDVVR